MKIELQRFEAAGFQCWVWLPPQAEGERLPAVYCSGGDSLEGRLDYILKDLAAEMGKTLPPFALVGIAPHCWEDDFSPWRMPTRQGPPYGGKCDQYLRDLEQIIQQAEAGFPLKPGRQNRAIAGYSMAGLASLYALYRTELFGQAASISGSLWFQDWQQYMAQNKPLNLDTRVYLSLGTKESKNRHPLMAQIADKTRQAAQTLQEQLKGKVTLEWNPGSHFHEIPQRWLKALRWLGQGWKGERDEWEIDPGEMGVSYKVKPDRETEDWLATPKRREIWRRWGEKVPQVEKWDRDRVMDFLYGHYETKELTVEQWQEQQPWAPLHMLEMIERSVQQEGLSLDKAHVKIYRLIADKQPNAFRPLTPEEEVYIWIEDRIGWIGEERPRDNSWPLIALSLRKGFQETAMGVKGLGAALCVGDLEQLEEMGADIQGILDF